MPRAQAFSGTVRNGLRVTEPVHIVMGTTSVTQSPRRAPVCNARFPRKAFTLGWHDTLEAMLQHQTLLPGDTWCEDCVDRVALLELAHTDLGDTPPLQWFRGDTPVQAPTKITPEMLKQLLSRKKT